MRLEVTGTVGPGPAAMTAGYAMVNVSERALSGNIETAEVGTVLASVSVGPVSVEDALSVAWLTREYNPKHLFSKLGGQPAGVPMSLHPVWFSGLVDAAISSISVKSRVTSLAIDYHRQASVGDMLLVEVTLVARDAETKSVRIGFRVLDQRGTNLATGNAEIEMGT